MSWQDTVIASTGTIAVFAVAAVLIWQVLKVGQVSVQARQDRAYQRLAEEAASAQQRIAAAMSDTAESLADIRARMGAIEKLMREVE